MDPEFVSQERDGRVLVVTLNRPEKHNAMHSSGADITPRPELGAIDYRRVA